MNKRDLEQALAQEVEHWPGVTVEFIPATKGGHPKARYRLGELMLSRPYANTPSDSAHGLHRMLGEHRRVLKQLGATRDKPEPSQEEDEAPYRKPNGGREQRPDPVEGERAQPKPDLVDQLADRGLISTEQADAVRSRSMPAEEVIVALPEAETAGEALRILAAAEAVVDGIYFGLDERVYHAVPRLSASGLQRLCVSPATFWRGSWLDPDAPQLDEEETKAQALGKAYHCARLEPDRFHSAYCRLPSKADFGDDLLTSDTAIKAALKDLGETQSIVNESSVERAQRLRDAGHEGPIWCLIMDEFEQQRTGRKPIEAQFFDQIVQDMQRIRSQGEIAELLIGGEPEVSVFWTDHHGLKCKCRFDYLTASHWADFKTFDNSRGKILDQALADAVRYNRYYVQAVHYRDGAEAVRTKSLPIRSEATDAQRALIAAIQIKPDELGCWYIFQEKRGIPNLLAREFPFYDVPLVVESQWDVGASEEAQARGHDATRTRTGIHARGETEIMHAKDLFVLYSNAYDPGTPWFPLAARARFSDMDFNSHWLEGKY